MPFLWYNFLMFKNGKLEKITGVAVPLGALYSKDSPCIGEFADLKPFAKFCKEAGLSIIQLLPVNDTGTQSSPYSGLSAFALHPIYIRLKDIPEFKKLYASDSSFKTKYDDFINTYAYSGRYDYDGILNTKIELLKKLYALTLEGSTGELSPELSKWIKNNPWVKTYAVYKNLKWNYLQASWKTWHKDDQNKSEEEINKLWNTKAFKKEHLFYAWLSMTADFQFEDAISFVHEQGISVKGDMPILMNEDSCDIWAHPEFFDSSLRAGSPCDGENPYGQSWGFPIYNWKNLEKNDYSWWKERLKTASRYYDAYRLDHILGFFRIWAIPEDDCNALNGHTEPYAAIKKTELYELGFDDDRIRWLSKPHIPTGAIQEITGDYDTAHKILNIFCKRIGYEELWLFNDSIKGSLDIQNTNLENLVPGESFSKVKEKLIQCWSDKTLIEIEKHRYVPLWSYTNSTSWKSLNQNEKAVLTNLFANITHKNEKLWKKQAEKIFTAITSENKMLACGEDLGVNIQCVPEVMKEHNILGLRVIRWCREWDKEGQPFIPPKDYEPLSVSTTSVHDSSTIRAWYTQELNLDFTEETAFSILKNGAETKSIFFIPPLQDLLYMNKKYWLDDCADERINIPGTVTKFNWTYRMPAPIEELCNDKELIEKINIIAERN